MLEQPDNSSTPVGQHHQGEVESNDFIFLHLGQYSKDIIQQLHSLRPTQRMDLMVRSISRRMTFHWIV
jgi:hypothetical protein